MGGTAAQAGGDATIDAGRDFVMEAAEGRHSSESDSAGATVGVRLDGRIGSVGGRYSQSGASGTTTTNASLTSGGAVSVTTGRDMRMVGANLQGQRVGLDIAGGLHVQSLQNTDQSESTSVSATVGFSNGGSLSGSYGHQWADRGWVDAITSITSVGELDIKVDGETDLIGALINAESGDLTLETARLNFEDIEDWDRSGGMSFSFSGIGLGLGGEGGDSGDQAGVQGGAGQGQDEGMGSIGSLSFAWESTNIEGVTRATVGDGVIVAPNDISALNRAIEKAQEITREESTKVRIVIPLTDENARRMISDAARRAGEAIYRQFAGSPRAMSARQLVERAIVGDISLAEIDA